MFLLVGFIYSVYAGLWGKIPDYAELKNIRNFEASELYSEDGELLGKYFYENRTNVQIDNISQDAINALIATEDVRFYEHKGIDKISLMRVIFKTLLLGDKSSGGGSTISQQLGKNLFPRETHQVSFMPVIKLKENFIAHRLEKIYSKNEILTLYLNTVYFGENTFGIESAAQKYFSVSASELTLPEAATLIGMLKGPSRYNPRLYPERSKTRRNTVISQMVKYEFLSEEEGEKMKETELELNYIPTTHYSGLAPYLREKIRQEALNIIEEYNETHLTDYNLYKDGLIITTTIDAEMQGYAEEAVREHMRNLQSQFDEHIKGKEPWEKNPAILEKAIKNSSTYLTLKNQDLSEEEIMKEMNQKKTMLVYGPDEEIKVDFSSIDFIKYYLKVLHPELIAVEPYSGKVKAWVGGLDYKYFQYDQVVAPRQVGSVFKPVVYSSAIYQGADLNKYYENERKIYTEYNDWSPRNSDGVYGGLYNLKGALSRSINTIAVEVLKETGIEKSIVHARNMGIKSDLPQSLSLALGTASIPLTEMVKPYMIFANDGRLVTLYFLKEIRDKEGNVLYAAEELEAEYIISADEARIMSDMLMEAVNEGTGRRLRSNPYRLTNDIAGKTRTTQNNVDGWFIGYNPRIVIGVRTGANDVNVHFTSTRLGQGANTALPIFGLMMQKCLASEKYSYWQNITFPMLPPPLIIIIRIYLFL
ncbi:MAG: transglycosylase domain-containing protein [Odoribacter sp.]|nr:transglycosylase domain-containing protein [Odoribacter sp.]